MGVDLIGRRLKVAVLTIGMIVAVVPSVLALPKNTVVATVAVGNGPGSLAATPNSQTVYVANENSNNISLIDASSNTVTATIPVGALPRSIAITPDGQTAFVIASEEVWVITTATNIVTGTFGQGYHM
jgi:YVTN family beta-propeller protein